MLKSFSFLSYYLPFLLALLMPDPQYLNVQPAVEFTPVVVKNYYVGNNNIVATNNDSLEVATRKFNIPKLNIATYSADIKYGLIGITTQQPVDNPYDNVFHIKLPAIPAPNQIIYLEYQLSGVTNHLAVARSINESQAAGAHLIQLSDEWSNQKEVISSEALHRGDNVVRFGLPRDAKYHYAVKDVKLVVEKLITQTEIVVDQTDGAYFGDKAYIRGIVRYPRPISNAQIKDLKLFCNDEIIPLHNGEFEAVISNSSNIDSSFIANLKLVFSSGKVVTKSVTFFKNQDTAFQYTASISKGITIERFAAPEKKFNLSLKTDHSTASIDFNSNAIQSPTAISITALREDDLPALNPEMVNVTAGAKGFRYLPHGMKFSKFAHINIPFDSTLIPDGYTADDIRTYYFDDKARRWIALKLDSVVQREQILRSSTTHFTDMIDGIIKVPESPQTQGYTPTSIKDFKAADPSAGINLINPPSANSMGNASLSFPFSLPAGRQGMQPAIGLRYNNEGGNSWVGLGWNLSLPAISIETRWGVPRYDAANETETYTINGEQLAPLANDGTPVPRTADKQFHPRIEGSFSRIIRHGDHPNNYWWEVTDKTGVKQLYGGTPEAGLIAGAVLKDDKKNIAHWALVETRDLHKNFVRYQYDNVTDVGVTGGSVAGSQLYISQILYTGYNGVDGPYKIEFQRNTDLGESRRKDVDISARLGFKMVSAALLRKISISFNNQLVRSYDLQYQEGAFYKTLLKSVGEYDGAGALFYEHKFEYYDDVNAGGTFTPFLGKTSWDIADDHIDGGIINPIPGFKGNSSALSTGKSSNINGGLTIAIGPYPPDPVTKAWTVGGSFGYGHDDQEGLVTMVDMNGNGLPDKIYKKNDKLFYRRNLGLDKKKFGEEVAIVETDNFSSGSSKSISWGIQLVPVGAFLGYNKSNSTATTTDYLSDFNGDGLMDIASNGTVFFNHINEKGDPVFTKGSSPTPNEILASGTVDSRFLAPDLDLQAEQQKRFPLRDVVRVWNAPFEGTVSINAPVQLQDVSGTTGKIPKRLDGVQASIQLRDEVRWSEPISRSDFSRKVPSKVDKLKVQKGDKIYFRLNSIYNGENDLVLWDPEISYVESEFSGVDANNKSYTQYKASEDFLLHDATSVVIGKSGEIKIDGTFSKRITSDSITVVIRKDGQNTNRVLHLFPYDALSSIDTVLEIKMSVDSGDIIHFGIESDSHIDRKALSWNPHYQYTSFTDKNIPEKNINGQPTLEGSIIPDQTNYNEWIKLSQPLMATEVDTIIIVPDIKPNASATGNIVFTVKGINTLYSKQTVSIVNGNIVGLPKATIVPRIAGERLYFDYAVSNNKLASDLADYVQAEISKDSIFFDANGNKHTVNVKRKVEASLFTNAVNELFGPLYRGWGQFALNGSNGNIPIDQTRLNTTEYNSYPSDASIYSKADTGAFANLSDPSQAYFSILVADPQKKVWSGYDSSIFVTEKNMSSSRLWLHDVMVDSLVVGEGEGLNTVNKITATKTTSYALGGGVISETFSTSEGITKTEVMDLNGDRYPDILNESRVQYTLPNGGREKTAIESNPIGSATEGKAGGLTLGGHFALAFAGSTTVMHAGKEVEVANATAGISGNVGANLQKSKNILLDINADGLPDKVFEDGRVALNLGYRFADPENWGSPYIDENSTVSFGAGLGVNITAGTIEAGFGLSRSEESNTISYSDVNGDGLPDKLILFNTKVDVQLNTGNGFAPAVRWDAFSSISNNISTGESINGAFSIPIPLIPPFLILKLVINPSFSTGHGVSRRIDQIMDVNGDRFPDILKSSDNDGDLSVQLSTIGRTNMLRKVQRPFNSYFVIDYERLGNTYAMPESKWVLKNVEIFDGLKGDGVDTLRNSFTYENGFHDRHEREFFGFKKVNSSQLKTDARNVVYRTHVQQFLNDNYYTKGLLQSEWLQDAAGNKYTQTTNQYVPLAIQADVQFPRLLTVEKLFYEGQPTIGARTSTQFTYDTYGNVATIKDAGDGSGPDAITAVITYHNNDTKYIKSVPSSIVVTTTEGEKRKRSTLIDETGSVTNIRQYLIDGTFASYGLSYDDYGNLAKILRPANRKGDTMWYGYTYDNIAHSYVTAVTDAFGYTSKSSYDYRFGTLLSTISMNNDTMLFKWDNRGRMVSVTGPYELASGNPYTIAFDYHPDAEVPYALTRHFDPEYNSDIKIIHFMDGLGRSVQVKKDVALYKGKNIPDDIEMVISGRVIYDALGRAVKTSFPIKEPIGASNYSFSTTTGALSSTAEYDVQDRAISTVLADGATTKTVYTISSNLFSTLVTDPLGNKKEQLTDVKGRVKTSKVFGGSNGTISTNFTYNALSELYSVLDNNNNATVSTYDNLGRRLSLLQPDAGLTQFKYDLAGNLEQKVTAQIRKEIPNGGAIKYLYEYERLTEIDYPRQYQNKVKYIYGKAGSGSRAGRMVLQEDASGGNEFFYGKLGEVTKTIRTVLVSPIYSSTFVSEQVYDTWNRLKKMTYPDGEVVAYHYNQAGGLSSIDGSKASDKYKYVDQLGYDEYEQRVYLRYGNGTETNYSYDEKRRRLTALHAVTGTGGDMMNNSYRYDPVSNILGITNNVTFDTGRLGGRASQTYGYDNLYRLTSATGSYEGEKQLRGYSLAMVYDNLYNIVSKKMTDPQPSRSYDLKYQYTGKAPHQASQIGATKYTYDLNGNMLSNFGRDNFWDEENRLMAVLYGGVLSQYTYDASGERAVKSSGGLQGIWVNGAPAGAVKHNDNFTMYVSPYLVCKKNSFTKHFYIESQRVATKLGNGQFTNISFPQTGLTAGGVDYTRRAQEIEQGRINYYSSLAVSPGPPTDKYYYARPENNGIAAPVTVDTSASNVPPGWPGNITPPTAGGPPIYVPGVPTNDSVKAGYGFNNAGNIYEKDQYFYHPDHLGSTSYVTDATGEVNQHAEYSAFGETFFEEHSSSTTTPYLFNAKERDAETGLYYYGARYYDPRVSTWLSVDPLAEKYPGLSPYNYALNNPIVLIDPDGRGDSWFGEYLSDVGSVFKGEAIGFYKAGKGAVLGVGHLIAHPIETSKGLASAVYNYEETGARIKSAALDAYDKVTNGTYEEAGEVIGEVLGTVVTTAATGSAVASASSKVSALVQAAKMAKLTEQVAQSAAELGASGTYPATIVGALSKTGETAIQTSGEIPSIIAPSLNSAATDLGGVGAKNAGNIVGCCGEFRAANQLLLKNPSLVPKDIKLTPAIRPRTMEVVPRCSNCKIIFGKD